jgi:hypothetical protein
MTRKSTSKTLGFRKAQTSTKPKQTDGLGTLPEWNLDDLYLSMDSSGFATGLAKGPPNARR